jgi:hypothetical protein
MRLLDLRYAIAADCPLMMERRIDRSCGVFYPGLSALASDPVLNHQAERQ